MCACNAGIRAWLPAVLLFFAGVPAIADPGIVPYSVFKQKLRTGAIRSVQLDKNLYIGRPGPVEAVPVADPALLPLLDRALQTCAENH